MHESMNYDEFMEGLCLLVAEFYEKMYGRQAPCVCLKNQLAKLEVEHDTWRINSEVLEYMKIVMK